MSSRSPAPCAWCQNKHQTETISQLRQEARQWKDQCLRLEETSRDWKEQFLRVEQERQILLSRIDELVAEKLLVCTPILYFPRNESTISRFHSMLVKHHSIQIPSIMKQRNYPHPLQLRREPQHHWIHSRLIAINPYFRLVQPNRNHLQKFHKGMLVPRRGQKDHESHHSETQKSNIAPPLILPRVPHEPRLKNHYPREYQDILCRHTTRAVLSNVLRHRRRALFVKKCGLNLVSKWFAA